MKFKIFLFSFMITLVHGSKYEYSSNVRSAFDQELYESVLDSIQCREQLIYLQNSSLRWSFLDASAKIPSGILTGNVNDLGDYFQCLDINEVLNNMHFQGKYCAIISQPMDIVLPEFPERPNITWPEFPSVNQSMPEPVMIAQQYAALRQYALAVSGFGEPVENRIFPMLNTLAFGATYGICVPKVCTAKEAIDFFIEQVPFVNVEYKEYFCRLPNDKPFSAADFTAIGIFGVLAAIIIVSTAYDLYYSFFTRFTSSNKLLSCFSVYTNTRRFLAFKKLPGALECVDGIRAISMLWVVVGHTYSFTLLGYIHNVRYTIGWMSKFSSTWINSAPITVDTFFMLSGVLAVYTTVGKISKHLKIVCYKVVVDKCLPQSWYLSVDVQLYFVCPLIMVWMFDRELFAWIALCTVVLLSLVSSSVYSFSYNFTAALANPGRLLEFGDYVSTYYINTLTRAPPFFIGMVYGYLLHLCRNKRVRISRINVSILWFMSFVMMAFCIFSIYPVMQLDHEGQLFDNFLNAYMRAIWACGLGWLIFACVHGYGGPINWFLSLQMWKLPARLSFAMYLVHVSIIMIANGSWTKTYYYTEGHNIYRFMSDVTLTFIAAFILSITIDAPFSTLQKLLMGGGKKPQQKLKSESQNNIIDDDPDILKTKF